MIGLAREGAPLAKTKRRMLGQERKNSPTQHLTQHFFLNRILNLLGPLSAGSVSRSGEWEGPSHSWPTPSPATGHKLTQQDPADPATHAPLAHPGYPRTAVAPTRHCPVPACLAHPAPGRVKCDAHLPGAGHSA